MNCNEHKWIEDFNPSTGTRYRCKYCGAAKNMTAYECSCGHEWVGSWRPEKSENCPKCNSENELS